MAESGCNELAELFPILNPELGSSRYGQNIKWTIENFNFFSMDSTVLKTPAFNIEMVPKIYWHVKVKYSPRGLTVSLSKCKKFIKDVSLEFTFLLEIDDYTDHGTGKLDFQHFNNSLELCCIDYTVIFDDLRLDTLNILVNFRPYYNKQQNKALEMLSLRESSLRSVILAETQEAEWTISEFSTYHSNQRLSFEIPSRSKESIPTRVELCFCGDDYAIKSLSLTVFLKKEKKCHLFAQGTIKLATSSGRVIATVSDNHMFPKESRPWPFPKFDNTHDIRPEDIKFHLLDDVLKVQLKFEFSLGKPVTWVETTKYKSSKCFYPKTKKLKNTSMKNRLKVQSVAENSMISVNQENIYEEPQFNFSSNLENNATNHNTYEALNEEFHEKKDVAGEVDEDLLMSLQHLTFDDTNCENWENARQLYIMSWKQDLSELQKMQAYFKSNVSIENVCDILKLAHNYYDSLLQAEMESFIWKDMKTVLQSKQWKLLQKEKPLIVCETLINYRLQQKNV